MINTEISTNDAAAVLYFFGEGGYRAGGFTSALLKAIAKADIGNMNKLASAFPSLLHAFWLAQNDEQGINKLKAVLKNSV